MKIAAASGKTMPPKIWWRCGILPSICYGKNKDSISVCDGKGFYVVWTNITY
jgi:hypothetical protein